MGISVVICCYNSSKRLVDTLAHLAAQADPGTEWELLIVDNNSKDDTLNAAARIWRSHGDPAPVRILTEHKQGLSHARETGVRNAAHDIVVFCDDDNWLAPDYLNVAYEIMMSDDQIGACGGDASAVFEGEVPGWFERYKGVFACHRQGDAEGYMSIDDLTLYGAGVVIRKKILLDVLKSGYSFLLTDRSGSKLTGGNDHEIILIYRLLGYKLYYSPRLQFQHFMPVSRMQWSYLKKIVHGSALGSAPVFIYADVLRYKETGKAKYKVSWFKDILKAINSARLTKITEFKDLQIMWARFSGGLYSVISNIPNYKRYQQKVERLYEVSHKGVR